MQQLQCCISFLLLFTSSLSQDPPQEDLQDYCKLGIDPECKTECNLEIKGCSGIFVELPPEQCKADSLVNEDSKCMGELVPIPDDWITTPSVSPSTPEPTTETPVEPTTPVPPLEACTVDSFIDEAADCKGELVEILNDCTANSFVDDGSDCSGELILILEECTEESFDEDDSPCLGLLIPYDDDGITTISPNGTEPFIPPKDLCEGEGSFKTVYGQRCKVWYGNVVGVI